MLREIGRYFGIGRDPVYDYAMQLDSADRKIIMDCQRLYQGNFPQMLGEISLVIQRASQNNQDLGEIVDKLARAEALHKFEQQYHTQLINVLLKHDKKFKKSYLKDITRAASLL
jgi:hypothetical protein